MTAVVIIMMMCIAPSILGHPLFKGSEELTFYSREQWRARPPTAVTELSTPVPFVVIHHTYVPRACFSTEECSGAMRHMQDFHQIEQGWVDIGYNFAVGSDGVVYEGRGWTNMGAHAFGFNAQSIGIVLIGDWVSEVPPPQQLEAVQKLIKLGVKLGYISPEYDLVGHRQVGATECPGQALFDTIATWDRFRSSMTSNLLIE